MITPAPSSDPSSSDPSSEIELLRARLEAAEETLRAIRRGEVDAILIEEPTGPQVYTLKGAAEPYQIMVEQMRDGAATVASDGTILYCNRAFERIFGGTSLTGTQLPQLIDQESVTVLMAAGGCNEQEIKAKGPDGRERHLFASSVPLGLEGSSLHCVVITDLTNQNLRLRSEAIIAAAHDAIYSLSPDLVIETWNEGAAKLYGYLPREIIGHSVRELFPDPDVLDQLVGRAQLQGTPAKAEVMRRRKDGTLIHVLLSLSPIRRDGDGQLLGYAAVAQDITERRNAEERLRESEEKYRTLFENMAEEVRLWQVVRDSAGNIESWRLVDANSATLKTWGWQDVAQIKGKTVDEFFGCDAKERFLPVIREMFAAGQPRSYDDYFENLNKYFQFNSAPFGEYFITAAADVTPIRKGERALRAAHDTFRHLVERSPFGIYTVDADFRLMHVSEGAQGAFANVRPLIGRDLDEVLRLIWPEPFASEAIERFRHTLATGEPYHAARTVEQRADTGVTEAYDWKTERITLPDGRPGVVCHFYDLSEQQRHQEHVELLLREINHRAKNMLSLIQAIARQTALNSPDDFMKRFSERLAALATNQDMLVRGNWKSIDLQELVQGQLAHFSEALESRIALRGPKLSVTASAAESIGMAVHELATNAAKYGALSVDSGRLVVSWEINEQTLAFAWIESDGPPVAPPARFGFGNMVLTRIVERSVGGKATIEYSSGGVTWRLTCPRSNVVETSNFERRGEKAGSAEPELPATAGRG